MVHEPALRGRRPRVRLERGPLRVEIGLAPLSIHVRRAGRRLLRALTVWACEGEVRDRFVQVTEGVIADERLGFPERAVAAAVAAADERSTTIALTPQRRAPRRAAPRARRPRAPRARAGGRGRAAAPGHRVGRARRGALRRARRAPRAARRPRRARDPARRRPRLHRPRLPARPARARRHPAGRLRAGAVPAVQPRLRAVVRDLRQRHALRARRADARLDARRGRPAAPARPHRPDARRPPAPLRAPHRPARAAAGLGLRLLEVARRLPAPGRRRGGRPRLPLARHPARRDRPRLAVGDAIQHVGAQPAPVPGLRRDGRAAGARPACAPSCGSRRGSTSSRSTARSRPTPARAGCTASRRRTTPRRRGRPSSAAPTASRTSRAGGWARGSIVDFTDPESEAWWRAQAVRALRLGVEGIKADDGEGYYVGEDLRFADGTHRRAQTRVALRRPVPRARCSARSTRRTARARRALRAQRLERPAGRPAMLWARRPGLGLLVAAHARRRATIAAAGSGFSNWSHDVGGYLGHRGVERCPKELLRALGRSSAASRR